MLVPAGRLGYAIRQSLLVTMPSTLRYLRALVCFMFLGVACVGLAQSESPTDFEAVARTATAEREAGHAQNAIRAYQQAVELKPGWAEGWWYLGSLLYDANQFAKAQSDFAKVVELLPAMGSAWNFLGLCEFETKDYAASRAHLEKGQALGASDDPEIARVAAYHLALLRIKAGEYQPAVELLHASFAEAQVPDEIKLALGLASLHVPLLPSEVDPAHDSLLRSAGEASAASAHGDNDHAIAILSELVKSHPATPFLHSAYGEALTAAHRPQEALEQQRLESELAVNAPGKPAIEERIRQMYAAGKTANAGPAESSDAQWKQAMLAYANGNYAEAASDLKAWLQAKPGDGTAWAVLGLSEFEMKDYDNALIHLQRGRALRFGGSPEAVALANERLAVLLNRAGQFEKATGVLTSRTGSAALNSEGQFVLGMALLRMQIFPEQVDPPIKPVVQTAGATAELLHTSQYDQAFANFESMLKQAPQLPFLHYAYGTALMALSRYDDTEAQMRAEERISRASELPSLRLASIAIRQHRPADAMQSAQRALALAPQSAEAHYLLGRACLESGDVEGAIRALEAASTIAPNSPEIHFNLAKAYARAKQPEKAEQERTLFVRLNEQAEQQKHGTGEGSDVQAAGSELGSAAAPR